MPDWSAIRAEYIATEATYRQLAEAWDVPYRQIKAVGALEGWVRARADCRAGKLDALKQSVDAMTCQIAKVCDDPQQFYRHLVRSARDGESDVDERIFKKADTKAIKDMVAAIKDMTGVARNIYGLLTQPKRVEMEMNLARLKQAENRLGAGERGESGVVILPAPEDAP